MIKNNNVKTFKDRLHSSMQGLSVSAFAKKCDMSETVIRDYLSGKTYPSLTRLEVIAEKCNVSFNWLATGYKFDLLDPKHDEDVHNENIYRIPVYKKQLPTKEEAQSQRYVRETPPVMNYPVLEGWASHRGLDIKKLIIYWAKGDLMAPDIENNNGLIINTELTEIIDGAIYLIEYENFTLLRKIRLTLGKWILICNNDQYPTIEVPKALFEKYHIVGRVVQIIKDVY
ncbi:MULTISPECIES: LexA family transcriptional regulator [unclassified Gilliamella]|uniref:LexA family transcriptional regulator n=1 Tax=unclassified Gilliamella TaxID=2685620 RepID=UPI001C69FC1B|nr:MULTISPECIES: LexA family transcriptional regulator [unclassified Gilliamella]MCX8600519.1 LexA family transcriptional regulator [Gilliamella sp. B3722]MCX8608769.1 LexA family transcriptional regulator [Gilliamella sp. B3771]MCX8612175.1 LexA family transcriptional regulator [Gilliamella sp. B3773]MCX8616569.1 LexA family transcriptional regulator [Gilliamella sp. B3770]MCX8617051.1 LexA family transcriptional regulator [Gilliamella sp. B2923]